MNAYKKIQYLGVFVFVGFLSVLILRVVVLFFNYEIGDFDGFVYEKIFAPALGVFVALFVYFLFRKTVEDKKTIFRIIIVATIVLFLMHYVLFITGKIGGWYKLEEYTNLLSEKSIDELLIKSKSRNTELAHQAWREFIKRGASDNSVLLKYLNNERKKNPMTYVDDLGVREVVKVLAENRNHDVIPFLREMLLSQKYIKLTHRDSTVEYLYTTRKYAKQYLSEYFDEYHEDVVISRQIMN